VQCFATPADEQRFFAGVPFEFFPVGRAEERAWINAYAGFGPLCGERNGDLLAHVSTAESAKDLDLLRQAVGEPQLNYLGTSYGTFLGATYANLFPDRVRAMVLDGNADPVAWVSGGEDRTVLSTFLRQGSDKASARALDAFLNLCGQASPAQCAFSAGSAAATQEKWTTLLQRLREQPVTLDIPPRTFTYAMLVSIMGERGALFSYPRWTEVAATLQALWTSEGAVAMAQALARARLLTVDGYGHSILLNPSTCANDYVSHYVVDGTLPPPETVCLQDQPPFITGPSPATR
jgi:pimeloyl-ACP methyl ester carboxylesterase